MREIPVPEDPWKVIYFKVLKSNACSNEGRFSQGDRFVMAKLRFRGNVFLFIVKCWLKFTCVFSFK